MKARRYLLFGGAHDPRGGSGLFIVSRSLPIGDQMPGTGCTFEIRAVGGSAGDASDPGCHVPPQKFSRFKSTHHRNEHSHVHIIRGHAHAHSFPSSAWGCTIGRSFTSHGRRVRLARPTVLPIPHHPLGGRGRCACPPAEHPLRAKRSFAPIGIPKRSSGTRGEL